MSVLPSSDLRIISEQFEEVELTFVIVVPGAVEIDVTVLAGSVSMEVMVDGA